MSHSLHQMNPFPGLRPFTREEDYLFFGREEQTRELLARLGSQRFVAVVGTSGSGRDVWTAAVKRLPHWPRRALSSKSFPESLQRSRCPLSPAFR